MAPRGRLWGALIMSGMGRGPSKTAQERSRPSILMLENRQVYFLRLFLLNFQWFFMVYSTTTIHKSLLDQEILLQILLQSRDERVPVLFWTVLTGPRPLITSERTPQTRSRGAIFKSELLRVRSWRVSYFVLVIISTLTIQELCAFSMTQNWAFSLTSFLKERDISSKWNLWGAFNAS